MSVFDRYCNEKLAHLFTEALTDKLSYFEAIQRCLDKGDTGKARYYLAMFKAEIEKARDIALHEAYRLCSTAYGDRLQSGKMESVYQVLESLLGKRLCFPKVYEVDDDKRDY